MAFSSSAGNFVHRGGLGNGLELYTFFSAASSFPFLSPSSCFFLFGRGEGTHFSWVDAKRGEGQLLWNQFFSHFVARACLGSGEDVFCSEQLASFSMSRLATYKTYKTIHPYPYRSRRYFDSRHRHHHCQQHHYHSHPHQIHLKDGVRNRMHHAISIGPRYCKAPKRRSPPNPCMKIYPLGATHINQSLLFIVIYNLCLGSCVGIGILEVIASKLKMNKTYKSVGSRKKKYAIQFLYQYTRSPPT